MKKVCAKACGFCKVRWRDFLLGLIIKTVKMEKKRMHKLSSYKCKPKSHFTALTSIKETTTTLPIIIEACIDLQKYPKKPCRWFEQRKYCNHALYRNHMKRVCAKTCRFCKVKLENFYTKNF